MVARELLRRGYTIREITDVGVDRQTCYDARDFLRAEKIRAGEPFPDNLIIKPRGGRPKKGPLNRVGMRAEDREAGLLVAALRDEIAPPKKPRPTGKSGDRYANEGFESRAFYGVHDEVGRNDEGETGE